MRRPRLFTLLCVGVAVLVVAWLAAVVVLAGLMAWTFGLLTLLAVPVVPVLLFAGVLLVDGFFEEFDPSSRSAERGFGVVTVVAFFAMVTSAVAVALGGPQLYHERFGERAAAVVSSILEIRADGYARNVYYVEDPDTGRALGELAVNPAGATAEGDRIDVLVDPRGWVSPVPVDTMGATTVAGVVLVCCFAAVGLVGLAVVGAAVVVWVRSGPAPPPGRRPR